MPSPRRARSSSLLTKFAELSWAVPQVVAHRTARMLMAGQSPSERDKKEFKQMIDEKTVAFTQSWQAMAVQAAVANQAIALSMFQSLWSLGGGRKKAATVRSKLSQAATSVISKGLDPVHRKAVANAKRLSRTGLR